MDCTLLTEAFEIGAPLTVSQRIPMVGSMTLGEGEDKVEHGFAFLETEGDSCRPTGGRQDNLLFVSQITVRTGWGQNCIHYWAAIE